MAGFGPSSKDKKISPEETPAVSIDCQIEQRARNFFSKYTSIWKAWFLAKFPILHLTVHEEALFPSDRRVSDAGEGEEPGVRIQESGASPRRKSGGEPL